MGMPLSILRGSLNDPGDSLSVWNNSYRQLLYEQFGFQVPQPFRSKIANAVANLKPVFPRELNT